MYVQYVLYCKYCIYCTFYMYSIYCMYCTVYNVCTVRSVCTVSAVCTVYTVCTVALYVQYILYVLYCKYCMHCMFSMCSIYCMYCTVGTVCTVYTVRTVCSVCKVYTIYTVSTACTRLLVTHNVPYNKRHFLLLLQPARQHYRTESLHPSDFRWHLRCRGQWWKHGTILDHTNLRWLQMLGKTRIGKYSQQDAALIECNGGWNEKYIYINIHFWKGGILER